ncbi:MAG: CBS domain-containing protein, partial [Pseudomonadota bacterium]
MSESGDLARETEGGLDPVLVADIESAVDDGDRRWLVRGLARRHPADAADLLESLSLDRFGAAIALLNEEFPPEILIELRDEYRVVAVESLADPVVCAALDSLDSDDAAVVLQDLEDDRRARILETLEPGERTVLEQSLDFDEETAGRLMQREFVAAPEFWTVGHTVDHARGHGGDLPDQFYDIYVVDPAFRVKGVVPLSGLLKTPRDVALSDIMLDVQAKISTDMDQEEVAFLFQKYHLASAPVIDSSDRIKGMITV